MSHVYVILFSSPPLPIYLSVSHYLCMYLLLSTVHFAVCLAVCQQKRQSQAKLISSFCALRNVTKLANCFAVSILLYLQLSFALAFSIIYMNHFYLLCLVSWRGVSGPHSDKVRGSKRQGTLDVLISVA